MVNLLYAVQDSVAQVFNTPYGAANDEHAMRIFGGAVTNNQSHINKNPEDFRLYKVGEFDDSKGILTAYATPIHICDAVHFTGENKGANQENA